MATASIARHRTALTRRDLSRPVRLALDDGIISPGLSVFDFGCGRGSDLEGLGELAIVAQGWDPAFLPDAQKSEADVVNLGYVINVIEDAIEREAVLREAWGLARKVLVVAARTTGDDDLSGDRSTYGDGVVTRLGTFQKFFQQHELREWIDDTLGEQSIAAAPGVFYVFRDDTQREAFAASRYRRAIACPRQRRSDVLFEQYRPLFEALMDFMTRRGRLPVDTELACLSELCEAVGSARQAFAIIRRVTGTAQWEAIRQERADDLLVYLSLAKFGRQPKFRQLPADLQRDVRAFFSTYNQACTKADELLFSLGNADHLSRLCRTSKVGKQTPTALYVHESAIAYLPAALRVYEGCARVLVGKIEGANLIKLYHSQPKISYLGYPTFEREAHPALVGSMTVDLKNLETRFRDFSAARNPPILHRKEEFLALGHPLRDRFARLTAKEERRGLFCDPESIGLREGWLAVLAQRDLVVRGHHLMRIGPQESATSSPPLRSAAPESGSPR